MRVATSRAEGPSRTAREEAELGVMERVEDDDGKLIAAERKQGVGAQRVPADSAAQSHAATPPATAAASRSTTYSCCSGRDLREHGQAQDARRQRFGRGEVTGAVARTLVCRRAGAAAQGSGYPSARPRLPIVSRTSSRSSIWTT